MRRSYPMVIWGAAAAGSYASWRLLRRLLAADLVGEVALVTGGSRGLGLLLAEELARAGCRLVICARDELELDEAAQHLTQMGADVLPLRCDVTERAQVDEMIAAAVRHYGHLDILVNNAGIIQVGPLSTMTAEDFEHAMAVNFWGGVHATLAALPHLRRRGHGRIVNITSIGGKVAIPHLLPYDCAKFAMVGFSEGLRAELAREGITVTTVVPGLMRTGSPVNAVFKGQEAREFAWFTFGDVVPLTSMNARRAARRVVRALRRGEAEVTLGWQAKLVRLGAALFPGLTSRLLGVVNRLLPEAGPEAAHEAASGSQLIWTSPRLGRMLDPDARRYHQYPGTIGPASKKN